MFRPNTNASSGCALQLLKDQPEDGRVLGRNI